MNRINEITERLSKATPWPWFSIIGGPDDDNLEYYGVSNVPKGAVGSKKLLICMTGNIGDSKHDKGSRRDADFIACAPEDITYLLSELQKAREVIRPFAEAHKENRQRAVREKAFITAAAFLETKE